MKPSIESGCRGYVSRYESLDHKIQGKGTALEGRGRCVRINMMSVLDYFWNTNRGGNIERTQPIQDQQAAARQMVDRYEQMLAVQ